MTIEWNSEKMATGFPEIDAQHKEWIRRVNEFDDAVVNRKGLEAIQNTLDFLAQYSETHFSGEEVLMTQHNSLVQELPAAGRTTSSCVVGPVPNAGGKTGAGWKCHRAEQFVYQAG